MSPAPKPQQSSVDAKQLLKLLIDAYGETYITLVASILPNLPLGCSWGFFTTRQAKTLGLDTIKSVPDGVHLIPLANNSGYVVLVDFNDLMDRIQKVAPLFNPGFIQGVINSYQSTVTSAAKLLDRAIKKGETTVRMGVLSTNESNTLTIDGVTFPAYRLDLGTILSLAIERGFNIYYQGQLVSAQEAYQNQYALLPGLTLAPSGHALLLTLSR